MPTHDVDVNVRLPRELRDVIDALAAKGKVTRSGLVRVALVAFVKTCPPMEG